MNNFKEFGVMLDCSRNAIMNVGAVKKFVDLLSIMGYNILQLYTEDTYEVKNEPYFGYLRGRYTAKEIKEIDRYAKEKGIELIPCIQTLAHLDCIFNCGDYYNINDIDNILLVDEPRTYVLIENIFATLAENFTTRKVCIGMDEAHHLGLGKYLHKHGYTDGYTLFLKHLQKVLAIAEKYGFKARMWSDMFFRLANDGQYYSDTDNISSEKTKKIIEDVPKNVELVYWDYYHTQKQDYDKMLKAHKIFPNKAYFAGGIWTWTGYIPSNTFTLKSMLPALDACKEQGVESVIMTMWGDNGGECSFFSTLPSLFYISEYAKGNTDEKAIKEKFDKLFPIPFDGFMKIDDINNWGEDRTIENPSKYLLFNDCFAGALDCTLRGDESEQFAKYAKELLSYCQDEEYGYIFESAYRLGDVLSIKAEIGQRTRKAYQEKSITQELINDYEVLIEKIKAFHTAYSKLWYKENKAFGFEIQDYRIGGLIQRITSCKERLQSYIKGEIDKIEELETPLLNEWSGGENFTKQPKCHNSFSAAISYSKL